jgi:transposase
MVKSRNERTSPVKTRKQLSELQIGRVLQGIDDGKSYQQCADIVGVHRTTISRLMAKINDSGTPARRAGSGRPPKTSPNTDRLIVREVKKNRFVTAKTICKELGVCDISVWTVRRRITASGEFKSYWSAKKPFLSKRNIKRRLAWCLARQHWIVEDWRKVMWTDESPFVLRYNAKRRVWRMHNERYDPRCVTGTVKHDKKIMVWGAFAASGVGILHRVEGIMTKEVYLEIVQNSLIPSRDLLFADSECTIQQDNDPKHTSNLIKDYWEDEGIEILDWPSQSPDLNPIENLWSILDQRLQERKPNTEAELFKILTEAWDSLETDLLTRLVDSMPRRCAAVIAVQGRMTKY